MENNKERVLAYVKAKEIDLSEQKAVAGGNNWTSHGTFEAVGVSAPGARASVDWTIDH